MFIFPPEKTYPAGEKRSLGVPRATGNCRKRRKTEGKKGGKQKPISKDVWKKEMEVEGLKLSPEGLPRRLVLFPLKGEG